MTSKGRERYTPFARILVELSKAFKKHHIPYMVFGGQAVMIHGEPRYTQDIDITLGIQPYEAEGVFELIKELKLKILVGDVEQFLKKTFVLPVADPKSGIRIDLVFSLSLFEREAIDRAIEIKIGKDKIKFIEKEDLIIFKIIAGRPRDIEDVRGILAKNPKYDRARVMHWLKEYDRELGEGYEARYKVVEKEFLTRTRKK